MKRIKQRIRNLLSALLSSVIFLNPATVRRPGCQTAHGFLSGHQQRKCPTMRLQSFAFNHWISKSKSARLHACHPVYNVRAHYKRDVCLSTTCKKKTMTEMAGSLLKYTYICLFALRLRYSCRRMPLVVRSPFINPILPKKLLHSCQRDPSSCSQ